MSLRLNVGCGRDLRPGFVNVDESPLHTGIRASADALPFPNGSASEVLALHVLEHVPNLDATMREIARVLIPGGVLTATVPYGLWSLFNPFHRRAFDERTMDLFCSMRDTSLEPREDFRLFRQAITVRGWPWWHLRKHFGVHLPLGRRLEITYWMERL